MTPRCWYWRAMAAPTISAQCLSSAAERNEDFLYICLDNEGYMNTGAQKSSSTPHFARTGSRRQRARCHARRIGKSLAARGFLMATRHGGVPARSAAQGGEKSIIAARIITLLIPAWTFGVLLTTRACKRRATPR